MAEGNLLRLRARRGPPRPTAPCSRPAVAAPSFFECPRRVLRPWDGTRGRRIRGFSGNNSSNNNNNNNSSNNNNNDDDDDDDDNDDVGVVVGECS